MFGQVVANQNHGLDVVQLRSFDGNHTCEVFLHGATIGRWKRNNKEMIFLSSTAVFDGIKAIRGGVPLVFPQFARPDASMPQHGFIRTSRWSFLGSICGDDSTTAFFRLTNADVSSLPSSWSYQFSLIYEVTLTAETLLYTLRIFNHDSRDRDFPFQALLHSYIRIPRIEEITVNGLKGWHYYDKVDNNARKKEEHEQIVIDKEVDRIYVNDEWNTSSTSSSSKSTVSLYHSITNSNYLTSESYATTISLTDNNSNILTMINGDSSAVDVEEFDNAIKLAQQDASIRNTDVVVWNAWSDKCRSLDDLDNDAYLHYICIEPGLVAKQHTLPAHHCLSLTQRLY
jgi:glucose-6-phosphate 1-epimerase